MIKHTFCLTMEKLGQTNLFSEHNKTALFTGSKDKIRMGE